MVDFDVCKLCFIKADNKRRRREERKEEEKGEWRRSMGWEEERK